LKLANASFSLFANGREVGSGTIGEMVLRPGQETTLKLPIDLDHGQLLAAAGSRSARAATSRDGCAALWWCVFRAATSRCPSIFRDDSPSCGEAKYRRYTVDLVLPPWMLSARRRAAPKIAGVQEWTACSSQADGKDLN
jgi:hypothetical protein